MSAVGSKNTELELGIRRRLFKAGFRYRLYGKNLPGKPDLVFPKWSAVILVHGCFWHLHGCKLSGIPKTRREWWKKKLEGNRKRDEFVKKQLLSDGWRVLTIWECSVGKAGLSREARLDDVANKASSFLINKKFKQKEIPALEHRK